MAAELGRRAGHLYPVDMEDTEPEAAEAESRLHHAKILEQALSAPEFVSVPGREKVQLEASSMRFLPLYREESRCALLVLIDPQDTNTVLAIYLHRSWWPVEDMVKTADPSREGLMQVRTFAERVVLFVLNCIIFGRLERGSTRDVLFTPHSEKECAKVFWRGGQAAAFYTIKAKGSLCAGSTSQCYLLPVLDTLFVRRRFRRRGLGLKMLQDFCQAFAAEDALGISCPLSAGMYQVCRRFLETRPEEQARLWEVEPPGDWSQRENIWLKMQLAGGLPRETELSCHTEPFLDEGPGPSGGGGTTQRAGHAPHLRTSTDEAKQRRSDREKAPSPTPHGGACAGEQDTGAQQRRGPKKRASSGEPAEGRAPKQFRAAP